MSRRISRALLGVAMAAIVIGASLGALASSALAQRAKASATAIATATPESVGVSRARLARLTDAFKEIAENWLPGVVMMVSAFFPKPTGGPLAEPFEKDAIAATPIKLIDVSAQPGHDSGGAGAVSTAGDYLRFAQMLASGGTLDGQRIMRRTTLRLMTSDHLAGACRWLQRQGEWCSAPRPTPLASALPCGPATALRLVSGSAGDFNWGGYAGTFLGRS
jgi:CubicO group peptidase (beta-lactamase class C family)